MDLIERLKEISETMSRGESTRRLNVDDAIDDAIEEITRLRDSLACQSARNLGKTVKPVKEKL